MAQVIPQFDETDIECKQHHHHGCDTEEEEEVVQALFSPLHKVLFKVCPLPVG
jgi:hypothetical protein